MEIKITAKDGFTQGSVKCALHGGVKAYTFPVGIFEIDEQLLIPEKTSIAGAQNPNSMSNPRRSPDWSKQTLFLATRGGTDYYKVQACQLADLLRCAAIGGACTAVRALPDGGA